MAILEHLKKTKLIEKCIEIKDFEVCDQKTIELVHEKKYVDFVEGKWGKHMETYKGDNLNYIGGDTYFTPHTAKAAKLAVKGIV